MMARLLGIAADRRLWVFALVVGVVLGAAGLSYFSPRLGLVLVLVGLGGVLLLQHPRLGLLAVVLAALVIPVEFGTGSEVALNPATMIIPVLLVVWVADMVRRGDYRVAASRVNRPLLLFVLAGLLSVAIGYATWNPLVPRSDSFLIVMLAQWAVFAFSAGALWLTANLGQDRRRLRRLTFLYLTIAAVLATLRVTPHGTALLYRFATFAVDRSPFWTLLAAVAGGQLLFDRHLSLGWRVLLVAGLVSTLIYVFVLERATASNWVGVAAALGVLAWLRWPRLRWLAILVLAVLAIGGTLSSAVYDFAGGDDEWVESGGSRLALIGRVVEVTMRNPVTGLGPAAYRPYARMKPLPYRGAFWTDPLISAHNNYVDLFAHIGVLGLALFLWFAVEVVLLGLRLRRRYTGGFEAGYVNGMVAAWAGALVLMLFADWMLPFVYNIGFPGFQASVLVWLLLGGLVALEHMDAQGTPMATAGELSPR